MSLSEQTRQFLCHSSFSCPASVPCRFVWNTDITVTQTSLIYPKLAEKSSQICMKVTPREWGAQSARIIEVRIRAHWHYQCCGILSAAVKPPFLDQPAQLWWGLSSMCCPLDHSDTAHRAGIYPLFIYYPHIAWADTWLVLCNEYWESHRSYSESDSRRQSLAD